MFKANSLDIFFALLRSGLYGTPVPETELPASIEWRNIGELAKKHTVQGIIIESIRYLPEHLHPTDATLHKMKIFAKGLIRANMTIDKLVENLVEFFKDKGITGILLKGQGVARYYPNPQIRHNGDIDFYVGKKAYKKAVELCKSGLVKDADSCSETEQHFDFFIDDITIEIHRLATRMYSPIKNRRLQRWIEDELEHSSDRRGVMFGKTEVTLPSYDFDAFYIFYHAWRHFITGGIGLRQLGDWAMVFHSHGDNIDTERLVKNIRRFGVVKGWKLFAYIVVNRFGLPKDKMPLYDPSYGPKSEKALRYILAGGNFGYYADGYVGAPPKGLGLMYGLRKFRSIITYFFTFFPLMPSEATMLFLSRIYTGSTAAVKRALNIRP